MSLPEPFNNRILIIDDNAAIHEDFRKIFPRAGDGPTELLQAEQLFFGSAPAAVAEQAYVLDSAYQGLEGIELIRRASKENRPYALAFVDVRMPPGLDGIETIQAIWKEYPELQVAICTAHSDYSWEDMLQCLGSTDNLLIVKKPFDNIEVRQIACAMTAKWNLNRTRQRAEEEQRRLNAELKEKNIRLEADLVARQEAEIALITARKAAEEASHAKSAFLANMSHEIRTPMNAIIGMTYLMKQTAMSLKQNDYVAKIDFAAHNLLGIINDILDFSKIEAGKIDLEHSEFNLEEVLSHLTQLTALQAQKKNLEFRVCVAPNTPQKLVGDQLRLGQVLLNLASNAIKFTEKGEVELSVETTKCEKPEHAAVRFTMKDTGIGMNQQQMERLFQPFTQADISTARRFGGTGLGLAISNRFVNMMGGTIEVQSTPGAGSTFSFTAQFGRLDKSEARAGQTSSNLAGVRRALIINGGDGAQQALTALLKDMSFAVTCVPSYEQAAREITQANGALPPFEIAFVNGASSGATWVEEIRDFKRTCIEQSSRSLPAMILIVSEEMGDLHIHVKDVGFNGVLIEPVTRSSLYDGIIRATICAPGSSAPKKKRKTENPTIDAALRGAKILLVEDNDVNQQIAVEILNIGGCEVTVASGGAEALAVLHDPASSHCIDAVLMDLQMPDMDGYVVTRQIRADERFKQLPILAMTADAVSEVKKQCIAAGMNDFLSKPIDSEELYSKLAFWVNRSRAHPLAETNGKSPEAKLSPDIDLEHGLKLVGGNRLIYKRALEKFQLKYDTADQVVEASLATGEASTAAAFLNTLGIAAQRLGLNALRQSVLELESRLHAGIKPEMMTEARNDFQIVVRETMDYIASAP
jgi:signal transduction histidine kinase/AmiR/NasT family two-component response regulator